VRLLPPTASKTSAQRLWAIAGRALADGAKTLKPALTRSERDDLESYLLLSGLRSVTLYDETKDAGTGTVPLDVRFGRFAYMRMRLAVIDWLRANRRADRNGKLRPVTVQVDPFVEALDDSSVPSRGAAFSDDPLVVEDDGMDRLQSHSTVDRWRRANRWLGAPSTTEFVVFAANWVSDMILWEEEAA
jgi:hypothetical protein